eukprot:scaffold13325_cov41-Cyclotella_meneghiniana.AAC.1
MEIDDVGTGAPSVVMADIARGTTDLIVVIQNRRSDRVGCSHEKRRLLRPGWKGVTIGSMVLPSAHRT